MAEPDRYLPDHTLRVVVKVSIVEPEVYRADEAPPPPASEISVMRKMFDADEFTDVVLTAEGREFRAHRAVLAAQSDVFRTMFSDDMKESHTNRVEVNDMSASTLDDLLSFIYTKVATNMDQNASALLDVAENYHIPCLKSYCQLYMSGSLNTANVISRLIKAHLYDASRLKDAAFNFIAANASEVCKTSSWRNLLLQQPDLATEAVKWLADYVKDVKHHNEVK